MAAWAARYLEAEAMADNTRAAKVRDLSAFMQWFARDNGHLMIEDWLPRDTHGFVGHLLAAGRAPATVNRCFATLRRFARWVQEQEDAPFRFGLPTRGVREVVTEEGDAKKLDEADLRALLKAADRLVLTDAARKNARPHRNRAVLQLLLATGLRVSELVALERAQYDGRYLRGVGRKGRRVQDVFVAKEARDALDDYLAHERALDAVGQGGALLLGSGGEALDRRQVHRLLNKLAADASKYREQPLRVHPHQLRHSFGWRVRQKTGSDTETAALLGHTGLKYVGRYARNSQAEREAVLESL
jgi:site-specific recombinase XerD